ncbi:PTS lactose/cellobiose transporter subunit IIA [Calorimonas adulescens]|uniref:PTS lactose/cellobiose transporter subunit IIA n=1 Tax=Calorimonas adulescens TaxID=2606906 RepID=A0A5D8QHD4_9THEO|nr:PTS lactose/cellobiose transporter subunit IIA [Calorimonas adulescens]TZE82973.1 PTS lactose/cellobiose transporter subunit IIA [Calorimonas adulescens]
MSDEQIIFNVIVCAGNARAKAFAALEAAKKGDFNSASSLLSEAAEEILKAHEIQNKLISREANGEGMNVTLLLAHAEDHLMAAILAKDLISEMIDLYKINSKGDD